MGKIIIIFVFAILIAVVTDIVIGLSPTISLIVLGATVMFIFFLIFSK